MLLLNRPILGVVLLFITALETVLLEATLFKRTLSATSLATLLLPPKTIRPALRSWFTTLKDAAIERVVVATSTWPNSIKESSPPHSYSCEIVTTWEAVQHCRNGRKQGNLKSARLPGDHYIRLVGEPNTGIQEFVDSLWSCLTPLGVQVHRDYTRSDHWYQQTSQASHGKQRHSSLRRTNRYANPNTTRAVVVTLHRDPVDWVAAMLEDQYPHADDDGDTQHEMDWKSFVETPVTQLKRDGSGEPYQHLLELRADKIRHDVDEIYNWNIGGYLAVRNEDLLREGMEQAFLDLAEIVGLPKETIVNECNVPGPQPERLHPTRPPGLERWVLENMDPDTERLLGYPYKENKEEVSSTS